MDTDALQLEKGMKTDGLGAAVAAGSFILWGLLPIYWKQLDSVPAFEILCHRMAWSMILTLILLACMGKLKTFLSLFTKARRFSYFLLTGSILGVNWLTYIWAVNAGHIIEASLGYFINPLVSVCFGVIFLKESIRPIQWFSVFLAFCGVCYLTWLYGNFPWIALLLAASFASYGLLRKISVVPPLEGLCLETSLLFVPAAGFLLFLEAGGQGSFTTAPLPVPLFLAGTGVATAVPLLGFCYGAQKIPLYMVGLLQYLAPTINLFVGIYLYNEPFPMERMAGFAFIWAGLAIFLLDGLRRQLRLRHPPVKTI